MKPDWNTSGGAGPGRSRPDASADVATKTPVQVVHRTSARLRLRMPARQQDLDFFLALHQCLRDEPQVLEASLNPATASLLVWHRPGEGAQVEARLLALIEELPQIPRAEPCEAEPCKAEPLGTDHLGTDHLEGDHLSADHLAAEHLKAEYAEAEHPKAEHPEVLGSCSSLQPGQAAATASLTSLRLLLFLVMAGVSLHQLARGQRAGSLLWLLLSGVDLARKLGPSASRQRSHHG